MKGYATMMAYAFGCARWDPREYDVYRVTIDYPILHTTAAMWFAVD